MYASQCWIHKGWILQLIYMRFFTGYLINEEIEYTWFHCSFYKPHGIIGGGVFRVCRNQHLDFPWDEECNRRQYLISYSIKGGTRNTSCAICVLKWKHILLQTRSMLHNIAWVCVIGVYGAWLVQRGDNGLGIWTFILLKIGSENLIKSSCFFFKIAIKF